jgi:putative ABC transport system substrate-binding protein
MKKRIGFMLIAVMLLSSIFTGCGGGNNGGNGNGDESLPTVGIVQIVEHPSLDSIRFAILEQLAEEVFKDGETMIVDYQSAQNEQANLKTICQKFVNNNYDLIIAIATPSAQIALGETTEIPIIFAAVTDPVSAELVSNLEKPGGNITGTSDAVSAEKIMELALKITPDIKNIGAIYNSSEINSVSVIEDLKEFAAANGLNVLESPVMNTSEIPQAAAYLADKTDAVFSPIDNTVASTMPTITQTLIDAKVPFYVGADSMVNDGGLATYGINYISLGYESGKMAARVLNGEDPGSIPVLVVEDLQIYINENTAAQIGVTFPDDILSEATVLGE